jgi:ribose 5-phosphate isomerase B
MAQLVIPIGADHRGYALKAQVVAWLEGAGHAVRDVGAHSDARCDALDHARALAAEMAARPGGFGVLICGSGQAMTMTANRYRHLRAALCGSEAMARTTRQHNDANVLVLGADFTPPDEALAIVRTFLETPHLGGKYAERRDALTALGGLEAG